MEKRHIISLLVEDHPGVLNRISGVIRRRNFNIDTILVGKSHLPKLSKIVITMRADARTLEQLKKQLGKTIDVVKITELDEKTSVVRELCLIRLSAKDQKQRDEIASNAKLFRAKVVDVSPKSMVVQLAGKPEQIDAFIEVVKTFGVQDISRTGVNAIARR